MCVHVSAVSFNPVPWACGEPFCRGTVQTKLGDLLNTSGLQKQTTAVEERSLKTKTRVLSSCHYLPVFSLISHRTLKRAGFIRWQFNACFLAERRCVIRKQ